MLPSSVTMADLVVLLLTENPAFNPCTSTEHHNSKAGRFLAYDEAVHDSLFSSPERKPFDAVRVVEHEYEVDSRVAHEGAVAVSLVTHARRNRATCLCK